MLILFSWLHFLFSLRPGWGNHSVEKERGMWHNQLGWQDSWWLCKISSLQIQTQLWGRQFQQQRWEIILWKYFLCLDWFIFSFILFSVHLLHAWILSVYQGENVVLKLQEFSCWCNGEGLQYYYWQENRGRLRSRAYRGVFNGKTLNNVFIFIWIFFSEWITSSQKPS